MTSTRESKIVEALVSCRVPDCQSRTATFRIALASCLGVHQNPVPAVQHDGFVVGVTDTAADIHARVAPYWPPAPLLRAGVGGQDVRCSSRKHRSGCLRQT